MSARNATGASAMTAAYGKLPATHSRRAPGASAAADIAPMTATMAPAKSRPVPASATAERKRRKPGHQHDATVGTARQARSIPTARRQQPAPRTTRTASRRDRRPRPQAAPAPAAEKYPKHRLLPRRRRSSRPDRLRWARRRPRSRSGARDQAAEPPLAAAIFGDRALERRSGRNPANRSERTPVRCRPPATAGNSTAAARRWCG